MSKNIEKLEEARDKARAAYDKICETHDDPVYSQEWGAYKRAFDKWHEARGKQMADRDSDRPGTDNWEKM